MPKRFILIRAVGGCWMHTDCGCGA